MVARRLARRIRGAGVVQRCFGKVSGFSERTVHFVRADVMEEHVVTHGAVCLFPVITRAVKQGKRAHHVRFDERLGPQNGTVDMAFRCKVHNRIDIVLLQDALYLRPVAYVCFFKEIPFPAVFLFYIRKALKIACIGKAVDVYNLSLKTTFSTE